MLSIYAYIPNEKLISKNFCIIETIRYVKKKVKMSFQNIVQMELKLKHQDMRLYLKERPQPRNDQNV